MVLFRERWAEMGIFCKASRAKDGSGINCSEEGEREEGAV